MLFSKDTCKLKTVNQRSLQHVGWRAVPQSAALPRRWESSTEQITLCRAGERGYCGGLLLLLCSAAQHLLYSWLQLAFFPNISAEILEEDDLQLRGSVYQSGFPYIWWFAYYCDLDQRLYSDGFIPIHSICSFIFLQTKQTQQVWHSPVRY